MAHIICLISLEQGLYQGTWHVQFYAFFDQLALNEICLSASRIETFNGPK